MRQTSIAEAFDCNITYTVLWDFSLQLMPLMGALICLLLATGIFEPYRCLVHLKFFTKYK